LDNTFEIRDEEIDVEEIMRKIRENIRMRKEAGIYPEGEIEEISPTRASGSCHPDQIGDAGAGAIGLSPEARRDLDHINSTWDVENKGYFISSHRPVAGRFLIRGRELVHGEVRRYVDPAIWKQREFNASTTRLLNEVSRRLEEIGGRLAQLECALQEARSDIEVKTDDRFNRVVCEFESQIEGMRSDIEVKTDDRFNRVVCEFESQIEGMRSDIEELISGQIRDLMNQGIRTEAEETVKSMVLAINADIENKAWLANRLDEAIERESINSQIPKSDSNFMNYFVFSEVAGDAWSRISGHSSDERSVFRDSIKLFNNCRNVLDIGCGRGSFLQMLRNNGINGYGIELNDDFVIYCQKFGLDVKKSDAIAHLKSLDDKSIDGIFMSQVAEHLTLDELYATLKLCYIKLQFGSYIIIAIPNILSMIVSANLLYLDPTHKIHIHPEVLKYILKICGFRELQEMFYQPVADELMLKKIDLKNGTAMEGKSEYLDVINHNIDMLNKMLFGYRDYVVIAKK